MTYLNLSTLKSFLGISATTYDAALTLILDGVEQSVETWLGRGPLSYSSQTEGGPDA